MSFHVTYNFVQGYDAGQKKIVASEMDQNFADIENAINEIIDSADKLPVGTIIWSANAAVPAGYLLCNGAAVSRETYAALFTAIGTTYGSGDGSTTFNLPNIINKFIEGGDTAGTEYQSGLPDIEGSSGLNRVGVSYTNSPATGAFSVNTAGAGANTSLQTASQSGIYLHGGLSFKASDSNTIYGNSTTVQPPAVTALPCIKY